MTDETPEITSPVTIEAGTQALAVSFNTNIANSDLSLRRVSLAHLEEEFKEWLASAEHWLASAEHKASAILAWVESKI